MKKRILTIAVALILFTAYTSTVSALDTYGPGDPGVPYNPPIGGDTADITSGENQGNGGTTGEDDGTTKCRDLGYVDASKCNGKMELKCPFKTSMVYCSSSPETPDEPEPCDARTDASGAGNCRIPWEDCPEKCQTRYTCADGGYFSDKSNCLTVPYQGLTCYNCSCKSLCYARYTELCHSFTPCTASGNDCQNLCDCLGGCDRE